MQTFVATLVFFGLVMFAMAIGVLFSGRSLKGSCGGTGANCSCSDGEREACSRRPEREAG